MIHFFWFYLLYVFSSYVCRVQQCIQNIRLLHHNHAGVSGVLSAYEYNADRDSLLTLRAKLFVLLDQDEVTRNELVKRNTKYIGHFGPVPLEKANRFYLALHKEVLPRWVSDETMTLDMLLDELRSAYLVA